jgi:hypothetical protein
MPTYKLMLTKKPDCSVILYCEFSDYIEAFKSSKECVEKVFSESFDPTKHSIAVEEQPK